MKEDNQDFLDDIQDFLDMGISEEKAREILGIFLAIGDCMTVEEDLP